MVALLKKVARPINAIIIHRIAFHLHVIVLAVVMLRGMTSIPQWNVCTEIHPASRVALNVACPTERADGGARLQ